MASAIPLPPPPPHCASSSAAAPPHPSFPSVAAPTASRPTHAMRIMHVASHLAAHLRSGVLPDEREFSLLCFALARVIDYAVTDNYILPNSPVLAAVVKQVYQQRKDVRLQPAILVVMISIKNASRNGWFQAEDLVDLLAMAKEISSIFCMMNNITSEESKAVQVILEVMLRFFPRMKFSHLIASFEVKSGYEVLVTDVNIPMDTPRGERIRLFVAQTDCLETSSCIISPPLVNFLINGKGVEKRTNVSPGIGPQFPTDISTMLKIGLNLFQAIGSFNGNYIIAIAVMDAIGASDLPNLPLYVQPVAAEVASDSEIIEGPSRISLNCPISFRRVKIPVKGHLCNHYQCFDFDSFMEMNLMKPSWRCPFCNQSVSYIDLRIDQNMVKILEEAGQNASELIVSADGSWKVVEEQHGGATRPHTITLRGLSDGTATSETTGLSSNSSDIVDLTLEEDGREYNEMRSRQHVFSDFFSNWRGCNLCGDEDSKHFHDAVQGCSQSLGASDSILNTELDPDFTATVSSAFCQDCPNGSITVQSTSTMQNPPRVPIVHGSVNLTPIPVAVQAHPSQAQYVNFYQGAQTSEQMSISSSSQYMCYRSSSSSPAIPVGNCSIIADMERNQFLRASNLASPSLQLQSVMQPPLDQPLQQVVGIPELDQVGSRLQMNQLRATDGYPPTLQPHSNAQNFHHQNLNMQNAHHQHLNLASHQTLSQLINSLPSQPSHLSPAQYRNAVGVSADRLINQQNQLLAAPGAALLARLQPMTTPLQKRGATSSLRMTTESLRRTIAEQVQYMAGGSQVAVSSNGISELQNGQNWLPAGRMRGSLSGREYTAALGNYMFQPTQSPQTRQPLSTHAAATVSSHDHFQ